MANLKYIGKGAGFPFNLSEAKEDKLAKDAANSVFGESVVNDILTRYHRSRLNYDDLLSDFLEYERIHKSNIREDPTYQLAFQSLRSDLQIKEKIIPYTTGAITKLPDFPNQKSPGLPYKLEGAKTKIQAVQEFQAEDRAREIWHKVGYGAPVKLPDVCLYARAQVCGVDTNKIRATWGYPLDVYYEEARFFYPILEYISSPACGLPVAYGFEMANGGMQRLYETAGTLRNPQFLMTDWSKFDKTIPPWLIRDAFFLLSEIVDFSHVKDINNNVFPVRSYRSARRWKRMIDYFVETPVRTCKGARFVVWGGVPSGSCFTNIIDTIINVLVTRYLSYETVGKFPDAEMYLGDDAVLMYEGGCINIQDIAVLAEDKFGMLLNLKKTHLTNVPENIYFLGYYCLGGYPFKPQDTLIASFICPERTRKTAIEAGAAALGQMWSGFDPYFAKCWHDCLEFMNEKYPFRKQDIVNYIEYYSGRFKYLKLIGLKPESLSYADPNEDGIIPDVIPKVKTKKFILKRDWNYHELMRCSFLFFSSD